jgi:YHYH protein
MKSTPLIALIISGLTTAHADPTLSSWFTKNSTTYARVIQTTSTSTGTKNTTPVTAWPTAGITNNNTGGLSQSTPAYADVQRVRYTSTDVYVNSSGLASYTMGPFLTNNGGLFGFWPVSQNYSIKLPRTPGVVPAVKTAHAGGVIGLMVNGVGIYDLGDAFAFVQTASSPVTGSDSMGQTNNTHPWWRDALAVEVVTFDPGFAHQPGINGQYHYHAQPKALRYQLGDNMQATYDSTNHTYSYTEDTSALHHSPILGWSFDGYPIYGPYGYDMGVATVVGGKVTSIVFSTAGAYAGVPTVTISGGGGSGATATASVSGGVLTGITVVNQGTGYTSAPMVTLSGVHRMRSGFVLRNGANGTTNITAAHPATNRTTLPKWAAIAEGFATLANYSSQTLSNGDFVLSTASLYGPATDYTTTGPQSATYSLGRYSPDYDYLGDRSKTQNIDFDLDQYNGRTCVTPDYPGGTYAYFVSLDASGNPAFPYMLGKQYYGTKSGATGATVPGTGVTDYFNSAGTNFVETWSGSPAVNATSGNVTLTWNALEGGTYKVEASNDLASWTTLNASVSGPSNVVLPAPATVSTTASYTDTSAALPANNTRRFYRATRNP